MVPEFVLVLVLDQGMGMARGLARVKEVAQMREMVMVRVKEMAQECHPEDSPSQEEYRYHWNRGPK